MISKKGYNKGFKRTILSFRPNENWSPRRLSPEPLYTPNESAMKNRPKTFLIAIICWLFVSVANWALTAWLDANVTPENLTQIYSIVQSTLSVIGGPFGFGFILGAAVFSAWDWPVIGAWLRKYQIRRRNKDADEKLALECEELSKYLYEEAAAMDRERSERHFRSRIDNAEDIHKSWSEARIAETKEEERIRKHVGFRVQRIFANLHARGVKLDLWGFTLSHYELASASYFFIQLADALRDGTYLDREFKAGRSDSSLPARM